MTSHAPTPAATAGRRMMLSKVPEVTVWFWIVKILCTTVGETFADLFNTTVGLGLQWTTILFGVLLVSILAVQFRLDRYVPFVYWAAVVFVSIEGTLLTDNLTDGLGVALWVSSLVFAVLLAAVFTVWYRRERTLSIHSITTTPREAWYWLAVLVTFALGTAVGDWTLQLTGWGPGASVLLPLALLAVVALAYRLGAGPVLTFWLAYVLTRPLGANLGDLLGTASDEGGVGLGTFWTSMIFLTVIIGVVTYLTVSKRDQLSPPEPVGQPATANAS